jgi:acetylglutamate kinase
MGGDARTVVVKVGGEIVEDAALRAAFSRNVRALCDEGARVVVVHGGGPQVTRLQTALGRTATKVAGQRVTGPEDITMVVQAICGEVNVTLCAALLQAGVRAFGCHGASAALVQACKRPPVAVPGEAGLVDYGEVGDVVGVDGALLGELCALGLVPVVATLGVEAAAGRVLNVNGDTAAAEVARALRCDALLLVSAVGGVRTDVSDPQSRLPRLTPPDVAALKRAGVVEGGMIPKVDEAVGLLERGVARVAIVDVAPGAFAAVLSDSGAAGTVFIPSGPAPSGV